MTRCRVPQHRDSTRAVHEALGQLDIAHRAVLQSHLRNCAPKSRKRWISAGFKLRTIGACYMNRPARPRLEKHTSVYISEPDVNR